MHTLVQVTSQQLEAAGKLQSRNSQLQSDLEQLQVRGCKFYGVSHCCCTLRDQHLPTLLFAMAAHTKYTSGAHLAPWLQALNKKLETRQAQLVSLQGAVIDLWGCCEKDASFMRANAPEAQGAPSPDTATGTPAAGGADALAQHQQRAVGGDTGSMESMLTLIKELLVAKSPEQAARHYQSMQQV